MLCYEPFLQPYKAPMASKNPQRSKPTSDLKSVTPITYLSMCILLMWYEPFWQPPRHYSLQAASKVKSDLSDLNYICCHVYLASNCLDFKNQRRR